ncbi:MAG: hypothetical protein LLG00_11670 [Planctomycetaceae bacterium]|nr:hypothetical protein [Planctomycetaceae bacterium]
MMDVLAPVARHVIAPAWARWERSPYLRHYRRLLKTQFDPPEVIRQRQWIRIGKIVRHACRSTAFWVDRLGQVGVDGQRPITPEQFQAIPLLRRRDIQSHHREMLSSAYRGAQLHCHKTSGSTGEAVEILVDEAAQQFKRGCTLRSDEWSGWQLGERIAAVWGNPEYLKRGWRGWLRNALLERKTYLDTLKMDEAQIAEFAARLRKRPPSLLMGHAHSLYLFAEYLRTRDTPDIRPRAIISTAMVLHDWERRSIEDVCRCRVTNRYGCEEVSLIACECERHQGLHVNADGVYVEVLRPDGSPASAGEVGMVVVTDLRNLAMPLLRYQLGDTAVMSDRRCACGRGLPLLESIAGRVADYVVTPEGKWISGISLTENFAVMVPGVAQLQIVQETIDRMVFRIVRGPDFGPASLDLIRRLVEERFGPSVTHTCEYVDRIPQEPSGKYRFCISKVACRCHERGPRELILD